jgi:hypothetical protein
MLMLYTLLTSALEGVGGQHHAPTALPPVKTRYPFAGGFVGPRTGMDVYEKSRFYQDSIPGPSRP